MENTPEEIESINEQATDGCRTVVTEYMPAKDLIALFEYVLTS